ncbi:nuclear transport factor 2 family protein [Shewanella fidelis]|uniref:nuclear transport factor 2 family protein n=1 Tax=Shewanella fidelis TaxID=173509 RepID=UPI0004B5D8B1|nr:nuclear transport factor 2 family protein [Shewanella fidelis]
MFKINLTPLFSKATTLTLLLFCTLSSHTLRANELTQEQQQAAKVLDALNQYSSIADWDNYFSLYTEDGIFIGTDVNEHWTKKQFEQYARPTKGWRYDLTTRKMTQRGEVIWFDEVLSSPSYGVSRGTGTLIKTSEGWKIAQYHLSFPIPNKIAKSITQQIMQASK